MSTDETRIKARKEGDARRSKIVEMAIAVALALIAAGAGYAGATYSVHLQNEHEDRTRYQEQRLETYTAFVDNAHSLVASGSFERPLSGARAEVFSDTISTFNTSFRRLQLAAGPRVRKLAHDVQALVMPFARGEYKTTEQRSAAQKQYVEKIDELLGAMRHELGTDVELSVYFTPCRSLISQHAGRRFHAMPVGHFT